MSTSPMVLTDDHREFQQQTQRFARKELMDGYLARAHRDEFPYQENKKLAEAGLTTLILPEELGGQGADLITFGLVAEEISYADPNCAYLLLNTNLLTNVLGRHDSAALRDWARRLGSSDVLICTALTEPSGGSDARALRTRATRVPGGWRLTGEKTSVTMAGHADAAVVMAQTGEIGDVRGIGAFLVELNDSTVTRQRFVDMGCRSVGRGSMTMEGTFVPDEHVVADPGAGFSFIMKEFDMSRSVIGLMAVGPAQRALDAAIDYSRQREAFGKPIGSYQGVSFVIAEHATYVEAVRSLALHALALRQAGLPHTSQAAMLKWWAPQVAFNTIQACIVLHGQVGWSDELPLQSLLRDVSSYQIGDGTPQIQKLVIARQLIGRDITE